MLSGIMDHGYHVSARALSCDEICPQDHTWSKGNCEKLIMHPTGLPPPISDKKLIADAIRKCGIPKSKRLIGKKAEEILRIMTIKMPTGHLNMATPCMHLYAIEYACQALKYKLKLREQAPVTLQLYQEGLLRWKQILKVKTEVKSRFKENLGVLSILAINYNFNLPAAAQDILQLFQRKLPKSARSVVKIYSPVYQAAAFFIAAAKINLGLDRAQVAFKAGVDSEMFSNVVDSIIEVMNWTGSDNVSKWSLLKNRKRLFQSTCHSSNSSSSSSANDGLGDDENSKVRRIDHLEVRNRRSETVNPPMTESELDELEEYQAQCEYDDRVKRLKRWKFEIWKAAHLKNWKLTLKPGEFSFESDTE